MGETHIIVAPAANSPAKYGLTYVQQYRLSLETFPVGGGTIGVTPSSADGFYNVNTVVTLTAQPGSNYGFIRFVGAVDSLMPTASFSIRGPATEEAVFVAKAPGLQHP